MASRILLARKLDLSKPGQLELSGIHWPSWDGQASKSKLPREDKLTIVVGPVDNNVFVLRCRHTGDAVLLDAANEHERLLELCKTLNVRTVLETHGHWDHIGAVTEVRDAGYEVYPTNPKAEEVEGVPCYPNLQSIPESIDGVVVATHPDMTEM